jgi:hypothetical protein
MSPISWSGGHSVCTGLCDQCRRLDLRLAQAPWRRVVDHHGAPVKISSRLTEVFAHAQAKSVRRRVADELAEKVLSTANFPDEKA